MKEKAKILDAEAVGRTLKRIAHEIIEHNKGDQPAPNRIIRAPKIRAPKIMPPQLTLCPNHINEYLPFSCEIVQ